MSKIIQFHKFLLTNDHILNSQCKTLLKILREIIFDDFRVSKITTDFHFRVLNFDFGKIGL